MPLLIWLGRHAQITRLPDSISRYGQGTRREPRQTILRRFAMTRSRLFSIAAIACAMAVGAVTSVCTSVGRAVSAAFRAGASLLEQRPPMPADPCTEATSRPRVALVTAVAIARRLIKRQRPIVMPQWRMCPSL